MKFHSLPTVDDPRDFYLGGLYSVVLFLLIAMLFFQLLRGLDKVHNYAFALRSAVTVSLVDLPSVSMKHRKTPEPKQAEEPVAESLPEETPAPPVQDISSLFSGVETQKIVHTKREDQSKQIDAKRLAALQKRIKTAEKRKSSATAQKVKNLSLVRPTHVSGGQTASGGTEVDAYYAKIQATIYDNFFPPANSEGSVALVRIWMSPGGRIIRFKVLRPSRMARFDEEVAQLEQRLRQVQFEPNPKGKEAVLDVSLVSKE